MAYLIVIIILCVICFFGMASESRKESKAIQKPRRNETVEEGKRIFSNSYKTPEEASHHGTLLMTLYNEPKGGISKTLQIYLDNHGKVVLVDYANRIATTSFYFSVIQMDNISYTYHPPKAVYTGATVGGIHTGGIHTESAYYIERHYGSGNGVVVCITPDNDFISFFVEIHAKELLSDMKKDQCLSQLITKSGNFSLLHQKFGPGRDILSLINLNQSESSMYQSAALNSKDVYTANSLLRSASTSKCIPMAVCKDAASSLNKAIDSLRKNSSLS